MNKKMERILTAFEKTNCVIMAEGRDAAKLFDVTVERDLEENQTIEEGYAPLTLTAGDGEEFRYDDGDLAKAHIEKNIITFPNDESWALFTTEPLIV